ncbi:MAG: hypothetical protein ABSE86_13320 [Bryobacteraceae bacterium]|jgi:uncharacterized protein (UPF0332 family)
MAYFEDLIEHAIFLSGLNSPDNPKQVDLRRAVSAAYYALFHLLATEAAQNWKHQRQRNRFARMFLNHGPMKACSSKISSQPLPADPAEVLIARDLKLVADSFVTLQQARHTADYDNSKVWSRTQVDETIVQAQEAIFTWMAIREKEMAQDYLFDLMGTRQ